MEEGEFNGIRTPGRRQLPAGRCEPIYHLPAVEAAPIPRFRLPATRTMSIKLILRTLVFLALLFVILYVGLTNPKEIDFYFPLASPKPLHQPAALIYFGIFAIGVLAGTMFHAGGKKGASKGGSDKK
jgi:hypothetical protein